MDKKCKTCAWFDIETRVEIDAITKEIRKGCCRYHAPFVVVSAHGVADGFPMTRPADWCRHWSSTTGWKSEGPRDTPDVDFPSQADCFVMLENADTLLRYVVSDKPTDVLRFPEWENEVRQWLKTYSELDL